MSLESISNAFNPATASTGTKDASEERNKLSSDLDDFLKLLVTQLKNQDPTEPQDSAEFTGQIAQFSQIEQALNTNDKLDVLVASQTSTALNSQLSSSVSYIGKLAEVQSDRFVLNEGAEPKFAYDVPAGTANSVITIATDRGEVVGTYAGSSTTGKQNLVWDGKGVDGERLPPGNYRFSVTLTDNSNVPSNATTYVFGEITGVQLEGATTNVVVDGDYIVPVEDIRSVEQKA